MIYNTLVLDLDGTIYIDDKPIDNIVITPNNFCQKDYYFFNK